MTIEQFLALSNEQKAELLSAVVQGKIKQYPDWAVTGSLIEWMESQKIGVSLSSHNGLSTVSLCLIKDTEAIPRANIFVYQKTSTSRMLGNLSEHPNHDAIAIAALVVAGKIEHTLPKMG